MKTAVIVSGSRWATDTHREAISVALGRHVTHAQLWRPDFMPTLVHGGGNGVDRIAADLCQAWGWTVVAVPAEWAKCGNGCPPGPHLTVPLNGSLYCPYAGQRRNRLMVDTYRDQALCVVAFPSHTQPSTGTEGTIRYAWRQGLTTHIYPIGTGSAQPSLMGEL